MNNNYIFKAKNIDINEIKIISKKINDSNDSNGGNDSNDSNGGNNSNDSNNSNYCNTSNNNQYTKIYSLNYNNISNFLIQTPILNDYELFNYNNKHYIDLKLDINKIHHVKFLTFIHALELKLNNYNKNNIKTQIITDIQNNKSVKVKLSDTTIFYDCNKNEVSILTSDKISLLINIDYNYTYYSLCAVQILQLN